jgi:hypothetical protein
MSIARQEMGMTLSVVVKSPSFSFGSWLPTLVSPDRVFLGAVSATIVSGSFFDGLFDVVTAGLFALEQSFDGADQGLSAGAKLTDAVPGDLFE